MKKILILLLAAGPLFTSIFGQNTNPAPYCNGGYSSGVCLQGSNQSNNPQNSVNDFIDFFRATGGSMDIVNDSSGCNQNPSNYVFYCSHILAAQQGATITCTMKSGITFAQGFAIFVDWNQDNTFQVPGERVAATSNVPAPATWTTLVFVIPTNIPSGIYRMRVRCAFATAGTGITPCGQFGFGETEDYNIVVGNIPMNCTVITPTVSATSTICAGQTISLTATTNSCSGLTYTWTGPGSFSSTAQNPIRSNATPTMSGTYSVVISNSICPVSRTVNVLVVPYPVFNMVPTTTTICQGAKFVGTASLQTGQNINDFNFQWGPTTGSGTIFSQYAPSTPITPLMLAPNVQQASTVYSVIVSPKKFTSCSVMKTVTATVNNPSPPTLHLPQNPLCNNGAPITLSATPGGGTWSAHPAVSSSGFLNLAAITSSFGVQTVSYVAALGPCFSSNNGTFSVSKFNTAALSSSLNVLCEQDKGQNLMNLVQSTATGTWTTTGPGLNNNTFFPQGLPTGVYNVKYSTYSTPVPVCRDSAYLGIHVFSPPTPTISYIPARCSKENTVALVALPAGGVWSGNAGVSVSGIQTPSLNLAGTNSVTYAAGQGTCLASSSTTFHVSHFRPATLTGTVPNYCVTYKPFNLMSIVQNTTGTWSGINVSNNLFNPKNLPTNVYTLTYSTTSTPDPTLCADSKSIDVSVLNPAVPQITQVGPFCTRDGTVQLSVSPATGAWTSFNYLSTDGVFTPSLASAGNNIVQYVIGTSTCNSQQTLFISVEGFVAATLMQNKLPDQCDNNLAFDLKPLTLNSTGHWSGPAVFGTRFDPAVAGAGQFVLTYSTASSPSSLCPDRSTIAVQVFSLAPPVITPAGPFCDRSTPQQLKVTPVGGLFAGVNNEAISSGGLFSPASAAPGNNIITYSITSGPCISYAQSAISVEKFVSAAFAVLPQQAYCENSEAVNLNSFVQNPGGIWYGTGVRGSMFDPSIAGPSNLITYSTHSAINKELCPDSVSVVIKVDEIPVVSPFAQLSQNCAPAEVVFNIPSNAGKGLWTFGDATTQDGLFVTHIYSAPGTYSVVFNYTLGACATQVYMKEDITVSSRPVADFTFSKEEVLISDPEVQLINQSGAVGNQTYDWNVSGVGTYTDVNAEVIFEKAGTYQVYLRATNTEGCSSEIMKSIVVKNDHGIYIPNSFTPNADGLNDIFKPVFSPYGVDTKHYSMEIFDRWGHLVFETTDIQAGWDGSLRNKGDEPLKQETYVYRISYKDKEGAVYKENGFVVMLPE